MTDEQNRKEPSNLDKQRLQERILRSVRPDTGEMTGKWVNELKDGKAADVQVPTQFDEAAAATKPDDMRSWIDKLFDDFQRYEFEYNKAQVNPDFVINSERPVLMNHTQTSS